MTLSVGNVPINSWHPTSVIVSLVQYKQNTHKWCRLVIVWWSEPVGKIKNESALLSHDFRDLPNQSESLNVLKISEGTHWKFRVLCFRIALIGSVCRCHSRPSAAQGAEVHGTSTWLLKISSKILARSFSLSLSHSFLSFFLNIKFTRHGHMMFLHVPTPFLFHHSYHLRFLWQEAGELIKMPDLWLFWKEEERPEFQLRSNEPVKTRWDAQISDQQYAHLVSCTSLKWVPL